MRRQVTTAGLLASITALASPFALVAADEAPAEAAPPPAGAAAAPTAEESAESQATPETEDTTASSGDSTGLQEIVVTAQKRSESIQDIPMAVTALTADQLEASNIDAQTDLPKLTPNLNFTVNSGFASPYIRGVGTQFGNPGLEPSVSVYLDDVYVPRATSALFGFADMKRIEVLKGPQGTLYGRNATGGAIRIISNDPVMGEWGAKASATVGSYQTRIFGGALNMPIADGVAARVSAQHEQNRGYVRNLNEGGDADGNTRGQNRNQEVYTGKLVAKGDSPWKLTLSADYSQKDDRESVSEANLFPGGPEQIGAAIGGEVSDGFYTYANDGQDFLGTRAWGYAGRVDYQMEKMILSSITGYRREHEQNCADIDATGANVQPVCGRPITNQVSQELQVASDTNGPVKYVVGLYYLHEKGGYAFTVQAPPAIPAGLGLASLENDNLRVNSYAPFAQVDWDFAEQWALSLGARYTWEKKKILGNQTGLVPLDEIGFPNADPILIGPDCDSLTPAEYAAAGFCSDGRRSTKFSEFTWKGTLSFKPIEKTLFYGTVSRGFKSGGFNLPAFKRVDIVDPEILIDYEAGWKTTFANVRWNGSVFYYDYKDLQITITDQSSGGTRAQNAGKSRPKGVETDVEWVITDAFELGLGGGYLDAKYKDFEGDAYVPCSEAPTNPGCIAQGGLGLALLSGLDLSGERLVNSPKWSGYVRGQYTYDGAAWGKLTFSSIANYRSQAYFDSANLFEDKKRTLVSAKIFWASPDETYFATFYGENLTDKKYDTIQSPQATGGWRNAAAPRMYFFSVGMNF